MGSFEASDKQAAISDNISGQQNSSEMETFASCLFLYTHSHTHISVCECVCESVKTLQATNWRIPQSAEIAEDFFVLLFSFLRPTLSALSTFSFIFAMLSIKQRCQNVANRFISISQLNPPNEGTTHTCTFNPKTKKSGSFFLRVLCYLPCNRKPFGDQDTNNKIEKDEKRLLKLNHHQNRALSSSISVEIGSFSKTRSDSKIRNPLQPSAIIEILTHFDQFSDQRHFHLPIRPT